MIKFVVPDDHPPQKARYFLAAHGKISTNLWKKIKWQGSLFINGASVRAADAIVKGGDTISYELIEKSQIIPYDRPLNIIYEDDWLLIINKQANQIIHPTSKASSDTLVNAVANYYLQTDQNTGCHPVYRLDRNTTGLIIVAKQPQIQYALTISHDKICRFYKAVVEGCPRPKEAMLCMPIIRKPGSIIERMTADNGQPALTHYKVIKSKENYSLVKLKLYTGRTHQIRVHMAASGHPLLGDDLYGGSCDLIKRQALHAYRIIFTHPIENKKIDISIPMPDDMINLFKKHKKQEAIHY